MVNGCSLVKWSRAVVNYIKFGKFRLIRINKGTTGRLET